ncbi:MAG: hypothetical protein ACK4SY_06755 [Pyrobaculum sp.]
MPQEPPLYIWLFDENGEPKYLTPAKPYKPKITKEYMVWHSMYYIKTPNKDYVVVTEGETPKYFHICEGGSIFGIKCRTIRVVTAVATPSGTAIAVDMSLPKTIIEAGLIKEFKKVDKAQGAQIIHYIAGLMTKAFKIIPAAIALAWERRARPSLLARMDPKTLFIIMAGFILLMAILSWLGGK